MQMTSKEIVQRAIHFQRPSRLPVLMGGLGVCDTGWAPYHTSASFAPTLPGMDEWGCVWSQTEIPNMGQVTTHPIKDIAQIDNYPMPDFTEDARYTDMDAAISSIEQAKKFVVTGIFMVLFERMHSLYGFENTLMDLYLDRPAMETLADRIVDTQITLVREVNRRFPGRINAWNMSDDWGTQQAAFISFDLWMDFFFPRYQRLFNAMHEANCDVWVHSCGKVNEIIEGYIQAGVNVVNLQQPRALGIEAIGARYQGRIAFESLADIQVSLPSGDQYKIDDDARLLMTHWASPEGGFILGDYGDNDAIGVKDPTIKPYMYSVFSQYSEAVYGEPLPALPGRDEIIS